MADERDGMIIGDRVEARLDKLSEDVAEIKGALGGFKMGFDQMDKRLSNVERAVTQIQWSLVSGSPITILAVILTKLLG